MRSSAATKKCPEPMVMAAQRHVGERVDERSFVPGLSKRLEQFDVVVKRWLQGVVQ